MKACFTGHRYISKIWSNNISTLIDLAHERGVKSFYSGMALGTDQVAAEVLIKRQLDWTAVLPCRDQDKLWKLREQQKYHKLLSQAPRKIVLYDKYSSGVMQARNQWMLKRSDLVLAIYDGRADGGTALTVGMAIARGIPVIQYNPMNHQISFLQSEFKQLSLFELS